ncbi:MAG: Asp-tRNA(Asn)/Glu-tRNA(Gln) amidotransferase subunit GatC [Phycisphaeraceae bacterium]|nr:Asp-tRNA(Asn)/Glu-tRNA(Gln) amidotransferase subunit GatC [Phycisphaeraceae bacterium]
MSHRITDAEVRHVAQLARLKLTDEQIHHHAQQLSAILTYVSKLNELDVSNVEPMAHALDMSNVLRPDEPQPGLPNDAVLANAPDAEPPFFKVIKVLGEGSGA